MRKIAIIVDSSAQIPDELLNQYEIYKVNNPIIFATEIFRDGVDIKSEAQLKELIDSRDEIPTTSQPSPGDWENILDKVAEDGYKQALLITLSSGISGTYQTACTIAETYEKMDVYVHDSKITTMGQGMQAIFAAQLANDGNDIEDILTKIEVVRDNMEVRFVVNDISHLQRTGRISAGQALIGGLLNIKPILEIDPDKEGNIFAVGKARKMSGALKEIKAAIKQRLEKDSSQKLMAYVIDANNESLGEKWQKDLEAEFPEITFDRGSLGPFITVHTGDGATGVLWTIDPKSI